MIDVAGGAQAANFPLVFVARTISVGLLELYSVSGRLTKLFNPTSFKGSVRDAYDLWGGQSHRMTLELWL